MFDAVADRYDRMNAVMTAGQERRWRRIVATRARPSAPGTGCSISPPAPARARCRSRTSGASAVACDFSLGHAGGRPPAAPELDVRRRRRAAAAVRDAAFDAVTISFGLRNVADVDAALRRAGPGDARRAAGSRSSRPARRCASRCGPATTSMSTGCMPRLARLVASNGEAYEYLAESVGDWPAPPKLARRADRGRRAGARSRWRQLLLGAVALHYR